MEYIAKNRLSGHWLQIFERLLKKTDFDNSSESEALINMEHNRLLEERLFEFQNINQYLGMSDSAQISLESMEQALKHHNRGFLSYNVEEKLNAVVSESILDIQEFYNHNGEIYYIAMMQMDIFNLSDDEIEILDGTLGGFDYEIFKDQNFSLITMFNSLKSSFYSDSHLHDVADIYHARTISAIKNELNRQGFNIKVENYGLFNKLKDWLKINFNI